MVWDGFERLVVVDLHGLVVLVACFFVWKIEVKVGL